MDKYQKLYDIKEPGFLKKMSIKELEDLSILIREFLIDSISKTGGHLSANLGTIEAIVALHYVFDSPNDKLIFDVGHQTYTHKILTGRAKCFSKLRHNDGISGFPKETESVHDVFEAGHSSTAISAMCGFLEAKKSLNNIGEVVSFIGDASFQSGISLAGLNYLAGKKDQKGIIILNDNEMSISKNTGGMTNIFNKVRIKKSYRFFRKITPKSIRNAMKSLVYGKVSLFTQLGYRYIGPIDGHNLKELIKYYRFAKESKDSVIIHIKTIKGKGYPYSENDEIGIYHGIGPFNKDTGIPLNKKEDEITFSSGIGYILDGLLTENENLRIITPSMTYGVGLSNISDNNRNKIIDVGICEENAVIMASALSKCGFIPIVMTYSTFFQRAYDQINHDIARNNTKVIFLADRSDIVSGDGDTHQGIFDVSMLMPLPNISICSPSNLIEAENLIKLAIKSNNPFYIRYPKININKDAIASDNINLDNNKWIILNKLRKINILSYGPKIRQIKEYFAELDKNADNNKKYLDNVGILNAIFIKPLDKEILEQLSNTTLIIFEEIIEVSSLSTLIKCYNNDNNLNIKIISMALKDYVRTGTIDELEEDNNLTLNDIKKIIDDIL